MAKEIRGSLFEKKFHRLNVYIIHRVNCVSTVREDLAKRLIERFGVRADVYAKRSQISAKNVTATKETRDVIGSVEISEGEPNIVAMYAQFNYGVSDGTQQFVKEYEDDIALQRAKTRDTRENRKKYFKKCLETLRKKILKGKKDNITILFPYGIGAEGNYREWYTEWTSYENMIKKFAEKLRKKNSSIEIFIIQ